MPHGPSAWTPFLPTGDHDHLAGTPVTIHAAADGQLVMSLDSGPTLFVSFDEDEDPLAVGTRAEITVDWTRTARPPASGITPVVVAWTTGGGVLQLAPEQPDPDDVAPGMRVFGGPELVLSVPPREVRSWVAQLLALPRRFVVDPRDEQVVWLGDLDPAGRCCSNGCDARPSPSNSIRWAGSTAMSWRPPRRWPTSPPDCAPDGPVSPGSTPGVGT